MLNEIPNSGAFAPAIRFWCSLWQSQMEQQMRVWAYWAQYVPRETAGEIAAEAEAMKPVAAKKSPRTPVRAKAKPTGAPPVIH